MEVKDDLVYFTGAQVRLTENYKIKPTDGAYQPNYTVSEQFPANIFIAAFDYNKSDFRYLTYIGTVKTRFYSFKLDQEKNVYIIGQYEDDDILMTEGAYSQISGNEGIYLGKLDSTLSHAKYFVGISEQDNAMGNFNGYDIAPFSNGDVAVVSQVLDPQFPIEEYNFYYKNDDPFYDVLGGGTSITKLNQNATEVIAAAHIEYFVTPLLNKIIAKVDNHDNLYIYSHATEDSLPTTPNHLGNKFLGDAATPGYLTVFDSNLDSLKYGTYICGNKDLYIKEIDIDSSGNVALLSYTWSYEYMPVTGGFFESFGDMDAHILVLKPDFVTGVEAEVIFDSSVKTYPNPISNGKLNIVLEDNEEVIGMQVYSYLGELVFNSEFADNTFTKEIELNVDNYTKGAYVIRIQCKDKVISKNIIVE
jgi:hypothetical protein